jgi:hypothetical protein
VSKLNILGYNLWFGDKNETLMSIEAKDAPTMTFKGPEESET